MTPGPWKKSSRSDASGNACVELRNQGAEVGVRDSKNPDNPQLTFSNDRMRVALAAIKAGQYDL